MEQDRKYHKSPETQVGIITFTLWSCWLCGFNE